jgi:hypothetical protein
MCDAWQPKRAKSIHLGCASWVRVGLLRAAVCAMFAGSPMSSIGRLLSLRALAPTTAATERHHFTLMPSKETANALRLARRGSIVSCGPGQACTTQSECIIQTNCCRRTCTVGRSVVGRIGTACTHQHQGETRAFVRRALFTRARLACTTSQWTHQRS